MIEYVAEYNGEEKPYICKKFTASSEEEIHTAINIHNTKEREDLSAELIYNHLNNLLRYVSDTSSSLSMIQIDENVGFQAWPIKNWENIEWAKEEAISWWQYIYFKDAPEKRAVVTTNEPVEFNHDHEHGPDSDHTHDPVTGEEIPNA